MSVISASLMKNISQGPQADEARVLRILGETGLRLLLRGLAATEAATLPQADIAFGTPCELARRIAIGEPADLLLTTDEIFARTVAPDGALVTLFAQDSLVVAGRSELSLTQASLLERLANLRLRVGVALPAYHAQADPVRRFFDQVDAVQAGTGTALRARAKPMQANGDLPAPRRIMEMLGSGEVDIVLGAASALRTLSAVADLLLPAPPLGVTIGSYLVVLATDQGRRRDGERYAAILRGKAGQALLERHGFNSPTAQV